jgi:hypothetical protein
VDAGGYRQRDFWKHEFLKDGRVLTWEEGVKEFVDPTGLPGPASWHTGDFPEGEGDYPVSGVSWYEAAAYAEYAGKSLLTAVHWNVARGAFTPMVLWPQLGGIGLLAPFSNFNGAGPVPVGSLPSLTAYGSFDMPGNLREWCWNETSDGRLFRGGAWDDNPYMFARLGQAPAMDRSPRNGFRLAFYPDPETIPTAAFQPRPLPQVRDFYHEASAPEAIFQVYKEQFSYDPSPLNARGFDPGACQPRRRLRWRAGHGLPSPSGRRPTPLPGRRLLSRNPGLLCWRQGESRGVGRVQHLRFLPSEKREGGPVPGLQGNL